MNKANGPKRSCPDPIGEPSIDFGTKDNPWSIFCTFLVLGCTSFGGPIAHLGYFREALVQKRGWVDDRTYADLVALCQFLPGPASSQTGFALGLIRGGPLGALAAFVGFTLPSAAIMIALGLGISFIADPSQAGWLKGFKLIAVAVVAQAVIGMARSLCPDGLRAFIAILAAAMIALAGLYGQGLISAQLLAIVLGGMLGYYFVQTPVSSGGARPLSVGISRSMALGFAALFFLLLIYLPLWAINSPTDTAAMVDGFYRAGSLVFGGGHVVLPMLQAEVVTPGYLAEETFLAGYGAAQALPGPLFTVAGFFGAAMTAGPGGIMGGLVAIFIIFVPGFLLLLAALPFWADLRQASAVQGVLAGVNAAVVGVLAAALYDPIITSSVNSYLEMVLAIAAILSLCVYKLPVWILVAVMPLVSAVLL